MIWLDVTLSVKYRTTLIVGSLFIQIINILMQRKVLRYFVQCKCYINVLYVSMIWYIVYMTSCHLYKPHHYSSLCVNRKETMYAMLIARIKQTTKTNPRICNITCMRYNCCHAWSIEVLRIDLFCWFLEYIDNHFEGTVWFPCMDPLLYKENINEPITPTCKYIMLDLALVDFSCRIIF
jgi:hypothetical protein